jgi:hypothetical protein
LLQMLDDPASGLTSADREARQRQCDDLTKRLNDLEVECPGEREYLPPPEITARRTM